MSEEKKTCRWVYCCSNLDNENSLAIEMRKHFTEAATEKGTSNLCLAAVKESDFQSS